MTRPSLFRHHDFRQLFVGDAVSQVGIQLTGLALPVMAVKLLHADEFQMGLLATCEFLAFLVIGLPAGAWVDRWRKQRVLIAGDLVRAVALASLSLAWLLDRLTFTHMLVVALVVGTATVFFDVAYQSYLPDLVEPDRISEGNAKLQAAQSVSQIGGPALAGALIRLIGAPFTIAINSLTFLWSAFFVHRIEHVDTPPPREERRALTVEIREGLSFVVRHPLLWRITACTAVSNLASSAVGALFVLFALRELGLTEAQIGLAFSVGAVGGLLGALLTPRVQALVGEGRVIPLSVLLPVAFGPLLPLAGDVVPAMPALIAYWGFFSFGVVLYNVTQVSFRQRLCPRPLLGRMNASIRFLVFGTMPIGALLGGVLGSQLGIRPVFWIALGGSALAASFVFFSPLLRMRDLPRELDVLSET